MFDVQSRDLRGASHPARLSLSLQLLRAADEPGARRAEPVRLGVPFPKGRCPANAIVHARDTAGVRLPTQTRVLDRWSDGSVRWLLVDFLADTDSAPGPSDRADGGRLAGEVVLSIEGVQSSAPNSAAPSGGAPSGGARDASGAAQAAPAATDESFASADADGVTIDTGAACFRVDRRGAFPFSEVRVEGASVLDPASPGLTVLDADGRAATLTMTRVRLEESGPVRAVVEVAGTFAAPAASGGTGGAADWLVLIARLHFTRGHARVDCQVTLRNPHRADHPGGCWDLGDKGSVLFKDASLTWQLTHAPAERPSIRYSAETGQPFAQAGELLEIYQDSSGGEHWRSLNHLNRQHEVPLSFRGYRLITAQREITGLRATPIVSLSAGAHSIGVAAPDFWQNFPKAIDASRDGLALRLFPKQHADLHELQGGEQKTHHFSVLFAPASAAEAGADLDALRAARTPLRAHAAPEWYCEAEAVPYLTPRATDTNAAYLALVDQAIEGGDSFITKREVIDQYGWRHYGDLYGDHEAIGQAPGPPLISHYNNQYDVIWGLASHFLRSGDWRWRAQMEAMVTHVTDIDLYHTDEDKAAYNHGLFWHTYHYVDVDTGTHRSYPAKYRDKVHGGGPAAEQNYATGLMLHYFMTGNVASREAAIGLATFVIAIDDGTKTVFRWLDRGHTGLASGSGSMAYHGPGRGPGNSVAALVDGHRLTGAEMFLAKAEQLIRRCIHPADDIEARNLLDAERRWYYTMFLQAVGKYLDHKAERGELDAAYAYARASLLHYARWMARREYPYLEKPDILEYPNETWAAQDMRKSQVFKFAARHATDAAERDRFLERSQFFFDYSTRYLTASPTRSLARPVVLLLANGFMHAWVQQQPDIAAPRPSHEPADYGRPTAFVPQRVRAKSRAILLAGAGAAAGLIAVAGLVWWLLAA